MLPNIIFTIFLILGSFSVVFTYTSFFTCELFKFIINNRFFPAFVPNLELNCKKSASSQYQLRALYYWLIKFIIISINFTYKIIASKNVCLFWLLLLHQHHFFCFLSVVYISYMVLLAFKMVHFPIYRRTSNQSNASNRIMVFTCITYLYTHPQSSIVVACYFDGVSILNKNPGKAKSRLWICCDQGCNWRLRFCMELV